MKYYILHIVSSSEIMYTCFQKKKKEKRKMIEIRGERYVNIFWIRINEVVC